jgi:SIR2-like domain
MIKSAFNPDQYMNDLRQILAQGRKRIGLLLGAGAAASVRVNPDTGLLDDEGVALIPTVAILTERVLSSLGEERRKIVDLILSDLGGTPNVEIILTQIRKLADALGRNVVHGLDGAAYAKLADDICKEIGAIVATELPKGTTPYSVIAGWIGGTARDYPVEIFTPNYDLLFECAFDRSRIPYFDGFTGAVDPFFDSATIANDNLPAQWAKLWKIHGSLGWGPKNGQIVRGLGRKATSCIYPTHLKYDQTQRLPYSAFMGRLRKFVETPDSVLIACGFSFADNHITSLLDEALSATPGATVLALQYGMIDVELAACALADRRANISVYARDAAVISCVHAPWQVGDPLNKGWGPIRETFWRRPKPNEAPCFVLGDFAALASYLAITRAQSEELIEPDEDKSRGK